MALKELESVIEKKILAYLSTIKGGFVMKVNMGGRPVKKGNTIIMIPFQSRYSFTGVSDIQFIWFGIHHAFEVKTEAEFKWYQKNKAKIALAYGPSLKNKKVKRFKEQMMYHSRVEEAGGVGKFVYSLACVEKALIESKKRLVQAGLMG